MGALHVLDRPIRVSRFRISPRLSHEGGWCCCPLQFRVGPVTLGAVCQKTVFVGLNWMWPELNDSRNWLNFRPWKGDRKLWSCRASEENFGFYLHDFMDQAGIETKFARVARTGFRSEVTKILRNDPIAGDSSFTGDDGVVNVAKAVLEIAAEDDALVSHSPVPLPVDMYLERLDAMAAEFAGHHIPPTHPQDRQAILDALDNYLYVYKGFQRTKTSHDPRKFYLSGVLTSRLGTPVMIALIYSEVVKRLKMQGAIDFAVEIWYPELGDNVFLPQVVALGGTTEVNEKRVLLGPQHVLHEVLTALKAFYWPWKSANGLNEETGFLEAALAINRGPVGSGSSFHGPFESLFTAPSSSRGLDVARARAAQYRLQRGIWTNTSFGDLRCALAASERLVMLGIDKTELRDYGVLLYHCGLYEQAFKYLNSYFVDIKDDASVEVRCSDSVEVKELDALKGLLDRLRLILVERLWDRPHPPQQMASPPEPW